MRFGFIIIMAFCLSGCLGRQAARQSTEFDQSPLIPKNAVVVPPDDSAATIEAAESLRLMRTESQASNNAVQNSLTGVGLNLGKLAEKVEADLLRFNAEISNRLDANIQAQAVLTAQLRTEINLSQKIEAQATAIAKLTMALEAMTSAQGAAAAGLNNTLNQTVNRLNAGRDVDNSTQFTAGMGDVMERAYSSMVRVVYIMAGTLTSILTGGCLIMIRSKEHSRRRADERATKLESLLIGSNKGGVA